MRVLHCSHIVLGVPHGPRPIAGRSKLTFGWVRNDIGWWCLILATLHKRTMNFVVGYRVGPELFEGGLSRYEFWTSLQGKLHICVCVCADWRGQCQRPARAVFKETAQRGVNWICNPTLFYWRPWGLSFTNIFGSMYMRGVDLMTGLDRMESLRFFTKVCIGKPGAHQNGWKSANSL